MDTVEKRVERAEESHMCALPAIRSFSFFFLVVVWGRQEACSSVIHGATCVN